MAFNGSGTFVRLYNWVVDKGNSVVITASRMDAEQDGIATGLSNCITKDGQTVITANIPMASNKLTGLAVGSARTDSITLGQVQDNTYGNLGASSGTDTYTASPIPAITAYTANQRYTLEIGVDNTGAATLNISAVGAEALEKYDGAGALIALEAGDLQASQKYDIVRDQANAKFVVLNPQKPYLDANNITVSTYVSVTNGTDSDHDIDATIELVALDNGRKVLSSGYTKQIDATFAAGDAAGGMADGVSLSNNTWYHRFELSNSSGSVVDAGFDTSITAANLLADSVVSGLGLTNYKRVSSHLTDGSANILPFTQIDRTFFYTTAIQDVNAAMSTGSVLTTISTPLAVQVIALMVLGLDVAAGSSGSNMLASVQNADQNYTPSSYREYDVGVCRIASFTASASGRVSAKTNTSSQIRLVQSSSGTSSSVTLVTRGYVDINLI